MAKGRAKPIPISGYSASTLQPEITMDLHGVEGVNSALAKMGKDAKRTIRKISRRNMKPMLATLRSLTPSNTGTLRSAWALRTGRGNPYSTSTIISRRKNSDAYYAHMIEDGFRPRGGETTVQGRHMLANTFRSMSSRVASNTSADLVAELQKQWEINR